MLQITCGFCSMCILSLTCTKRYPSDWDFLLSLLLRFACYTPWVQIFTQYVFGIMGVKMPAAEWIIPWKQGGNLCVLSVDFFFFYEIAVAIIGIHLNVLGKKIAVFTKVIISMKICDICTFLSQPYLFL